MKNQRIIRIKVSRHADHFSDSFNPRFAHYCLRHTGTCHQVEEGMTEEFVRTDSVRTLVGLQILCDTRKDDGEKMWYFTVHVPRWMMTQ